MFNPFGPNVVDGPFSWLDTRPVYLGRPPWVHKSRILVRTSPPNLGVDVGLVPDRPTLLRLNIAIQNRSETVELLTCDCLGAGDGNRTRVISLEGWGSTIELRPQEYGRDDRIRTCDILLPKQARYQTAPRPEGVEQLRSKPCVSQSEGNYRGDSPPVQAQKP